MRFRKAVLEGLPKKDNRQNPGGSGLGGELPNLASKNAGCPVKFNFQMTTGSKRQILHGTTLRRWNHVKTKYGHCMSAQWEHGLTNHKSNQMGHWVHLSLGIPASKSSWEPNSTNSRTGPQGNLKMQLANWNSCTCMSVRTLGFIAAACPSTQVRARWDTKRKTGTVYPDCWVCHASLWLVFNSFAAMFG